MVKLNDSKTIHNSLQGQVKIKTAQVIMRLIIQEIGGEIRLLTTVKRIPCDFPHKEFSTSQIERKSGL